MTVVLLFYYGIGQVRQDDWDVDAIVVVLSIVSKIVCVPT